MAQKRHKYGAKPTTVDGILFASKAEAKRYAELKLLEKASEIRSLQLQRRYPLYVEGVDGAMYRIGDYVADFVYERFKWPGRSKECETVIEDVKGMPTPMYRWKKKHFEAQYGWQISEITS